MAYLALARKWRPQTFEAITGQEHVTRTLMNAIEQDRVHHAFLFCGARGVGKTTAARVLARALNCDQGPTPEPCGTCRACTEIAASSSIDVLEIDGASNRGIGEIRELREGIAYAPQRDRTKIYIIDEVHMLTTEAFNALLKTLEEPPSHVKFIFATTEPQRIPVTILSRCQRFDFKRIGQEQMLATLRGILKQEGVQIDDDGLRLIARESEGSMRDALSLMDRIISFCGNEATGEDVGQVLGVADRRWMDNLIDAALQGESPAALEVVAEIFEFGTDLRHFTRDLLRSLRNLVVLRVAPDAPELTDLSDTERDAHLERIQNQSPQRLQRLFQIVLDTSERLAHSNFPRLELEMAVVRMCHVRPLKDLDGLVQRLAALERRLGGAPTAPQVEEKKRPFEPRAESPKQNSAPPVKPVPDRQRQAEPTGAHAPQEPTPKPAKPTPEPAKPTPEPSAAAKPTPEPAKPTPEPAEPTPEQAKPTPEQAKPTPEPAKPTPEPSAAAEPTPPTPSSGETSPLPTAALLTAPSVQPAPAPEPARPERTPKPVTAPTPFALTPSDPVGPLRDAARLALDDFRLGLNASALDHDSWDAIVDRLVHRSVPWAASLEHAEFQRSESGKIILGFERGSANFSRVEEHGQELLGYLKGELEGVSGVGFEEVETAEQCPHRRRMLRVRGELQRRREAIEGHEMVAALVERFDAKVTQIRVFGEEEVNEY